MKTRPAHARYALWAALPMAQTLRIEGRLTMILDETRCRSVLTRRVLLMALALASSVLILLAILRPAARAQTVAAAVGYDAILPDGGHVALVGLKEVAFTPRSWHTPDGALLPRPPLAIDPELWSVGPIPNGFRHYALAFRLSSAIPPDASYIYDAPGSDGMRMPPEETQRRNLLLLELMYPVNVQCAPTVKVGVASGAWVEKASSASMGSTGAGGLYDKNTSYLFSPFGADAQGCSYTVTIGSPRMDYRLVAVDKRGRTRQPVKVDAASNDASLHFIQQITAHFDLPVSQIQSVRVEGRPFHWVEFKDIVLQPSQSGAKV